MESLQYFEPKESPINPAGLRKVYFNVSKVLRKAFMVPEV
jgi:hypothetical protein